MIVTNHLADICAFFEAFVKVDELENYLELACVVGDGKK